MEESKYCGNVNLYQHSLTYESCDLIERDVDQHLAVIELQAKMDELTLIKKALKAGGEGQYRPVYKLIEARLKHYTTIMNEFNPMITEKITVPSDTYNSNQ